MRILVVSSYPPTRCGIGRYAANQVQRLRSEGHTVEVMSLDGQGAVDHLLDWSGSAARRAALARLQGYDRVILHYATGLLPEDREAHRAFHLEVGQAARKMPEAFEVVVHEVEYPPRSPLWRTLNRFWRSVPTIVLHTSRERDRLLECYPDASRKRIVVSPADADIFRWYHGTRAEARRRIGLPAESVVFLSVGFLQDTKGFDVAVTTFGRAEGLHPRAHYYIVGSARLPEHEAYVAALRRAAEATPRVTLREEFLEDEAFDCWIAASDWVVLPYRRIWSSAVFGRAHAYGRPVIATDVGGLPDQAGPDDFIVRNEEELQAALEAASWRVGDATDG